MDWEMIAVYGFCAAAVVYVGGLLLGLCLDFSRSQARRNQPDAG